MRFDLCVNAMYKDAMTKGVITVNNGRTNRPILGIVDAVQAYIKAVETDMGGSRVFNVCSYNYDMEAVGRIVSQLTGARLIINHEPELRDYRIDCQAARLLLGFEQTQTVSDIVAELQEKCAGIDFEDDRYYNIRMLKKAK